jgi:hypothetical protein
MKIFFLLPLLLNSVNAADFCPVRQTTPPTCNMPQNRQCWGEYDIYTDYSVVFPETNIVRQVRTSNLAASWQNRLLLTDVV